MSGKKRKAKTLSEARDEYDQKAKEARSARNALGAYLRLDYSPAAFDTITRVGREALDLCGKESAAAADLKKLYEGLLHDMQRKLDKLSLDKKRLTLQLREALKVQVVTASKEQDGNSDSETENGKEKKAANGESAKNCEKMKKKKKEKKRGAPKGHKGGTRPTPEKADHEQVVLPPERCECGCGEIILEDVFDEKFIEDIIPIIKEVTKLKYQRGHCAECGKLVRHKQAHAGPKTSIGPVLSAHLTYLRKMGLTFGQLSDLCHNVLKIPLERSGVLGIVNRVTDMMEWVYDVIGFKVRLEDIIYADETGWKTRGVPWYVWVFCNSELAYFHSVKSRASKVVTDILGEGFKGIVVCDFYAAYNIIAKTQRCLVHLLRDIKKEREILRGSKSLADFDRRVRDFINNGLEIRKMPEGVEKQKRIDALKKTLDAITRMKINKGKGVTLLKRIEKYKEDIFRFVENPDVDYHNNRSERQLRPIVVSRKTSFGSDTPEGAKRMCVLHSVIETCKLQKLKPLEFIEKIIKHAGIKSFDLLKAKLLPI
jgi:hypothetical protein